MWAKRMRKRSRVLALAVRIPGIHATMREMIGWDRVAHRAIGSFPWRLSVTGSQVERMAHDHKTGLRYGLHASRGAVT